ncbi:selenide, water dikinase SelD, partial [Cyanobium sp. HWJ4-Hawea]|uniref:selenide, water dikinase SelD n=1 Tax=Cyanobium sp. HWJ4-Hawea TaxID=2823713 RepID=UPI0020CDD158
RLGSKAANRRGRQLLQQAAIPLTVPGPTNAACPDLTANGSADQNLLCTGSQSPAWLAESGLPTDGSGRVLTETSLQVLGHGGLFASGDCGVIASHPRPASGVWAVRAAPVLAANLERSLQNQLIAEPKRKPLQSWRPQRQVLQLVGDGGSITGRPRALALWGPFAFGPSRLLWRWKEAIDRRFMAGFEDLQAMGQGANQPANQPGNQPAMACRGCAAKLPAAPLQAALQRSGINRAPEDAALVGTGACGELLLQSVDGFPALVADPWLNARLTTLHACSDLWACGARVDSGQAVVTLPEAGPQLQAELLSQTLAGIQSVLEPMGAGLIGGHTLEGRDGSGLSLVLSVNGSAAEAWGKGPLRSGDDLILAKAIGTGVLFAAQMAHAPSRLCPPQAIDRTLEVMQQNQAQCVAVLAAGRCKACTDVTGFGLLGHLGEMLAASPAGLKVVLDRDALAALALPGALALLEAGYASSLAPANGAALSLLAGQVELELCPNGLGGLLIDPQTCGPLLAAVPKEQSGAVLANLRALGFSSAARIGSVA